MDCDDDRDSGWEGVGGSGGGLRMEMEEGSTGIGKDHFTDGKRNDR
jgi:hypothetical protein